MSYQSLTFIMFCAAVLVLYYLTGRKGQLFVLAAANLAFYAIAGIKYLPFLLITMLSTYFSGLIIGRIYDKADKKLSECQTPADKKSVRAKAKKSAKIYLVAALTVSVALLAVCKYTGFITENINRLGIVQVPTFKMILPLGISFYTFMAISYVLDVYWKRYKAERNFLLYAVYLSYFPHVVQGPIDRFSEFKEQVKGGVRADYKNITFGAQLAIWGFFKKLVIADRLGLIVDRIIDDWQSFDGVILAGAILVYSIQIYADFSGCIDIVSGISEMFGIKLRKNFNHPYFSRTMAEFWRRWHISLQEWFKDYIYFPVSASEFTKKVKKKLKAKGKKRAEQLFGSCYPVLVVWLITGLWHGAAWKFVAWGLFHAALLIGSQVFAPLFEKTNKALRLNTNRLSFRLWQILRTFLLCSIGRIFFRASDMTAALGIIKRIVFRFNFPSLFAYKITEQDTLEMVTIHIIVAGLAMLVLLFVDYLQERMSVREAIAKQGIVFRWIIIFAGLFAVIMLGVYGAGYDASSFIYEQF